MLIESAKQDILERISAKVGYAVGESSLSPALRQSITTLAPVERSLYTMRQIYFAEVNRSNQNFVTRFATRGDKHAIERDGQEVQRLKTAVDSKVEDLSKRVLMEQTLKHTVGESPVEANGSATLTALKCPNCGAALPFPTSIMVKCDYCGGSLSIQNLQLLREFNIRFPDLINSHDLPTSPITKQTAIRIDVR